MQVTLEHITPNAEEFIGKMAAICYDAKLDTGSCIRRAAKCADDGHLATLRFAIAVFNIKGISRICANQLVRSKHLDFLQRSQRYCKESEAEFIIPKGLDQYQEVCFQTHYMETSSLYRELINLGVKKEDARFVLPGAIETELNVVGNLQAWKDFIKLRADKHAQWEIRKVATIINNILAAECPNIFKEIE
ncbi:MAG TPA: FAD-dependent thymidylate synthase [Methanosarcina sp.]|nr:FAD-dependent thymidylate synthase [Methanosarcina sp.]